MKTRVVLIGIGGASCSGKTTLATSLRLVLPGCSILHQDDFWTASENLPVHPEYKVPNGEDAAGAIEWPRFCTAVSQLKASLSGDTLDSGCPELKQGLGPIPASSSFNFLSDKVIAEWRDRFRQVQKEWLTRGINIEWKIVEGFVLFHDSTVVKNLDVKVFIRSPGHILKQRRLDRSYTSSNGEAWLEPPNYWEQIAYPAYVRAHSCLFREGDVDDGNLSRKARALGLLVLEGQGTKKNLSFEDLFKTISGAVLLKSQQPKLQFWEFWSTRFIPA